MLKKLLLTATALLALAVPASAATIQLGDNITQWTVDGATALQFNQFIQPAGNQPLNNPCLICGDHQPQQGTVIGYNNFHNTGGNTTYRMFSSAVVGERLANDQLASGYLIDIDSPFLLAIAGNLTFSVGIDVNQTGTAQQLNSFAFINLSTQTILAQYSLFDPASTPMPATANGTGFPDFTLSGFSLAGVSNGDRIAFWVSYEGNDGPDSFFLMRQVAEPVPEPATWLMMILGFLGVGAWARRRSKALTV